MKWFFLPFIPLLAVVGNLAVFADFSPLRVALAVAFNLFIIGLASVWWYAYFAAGDRRGQGLIISHSLLHLSVGIAVSATGVFSLVTEDCAVIGSPSHPGRLSSLVASFAQSHGLCRLLGLLVGALGLLLAFPSLKLLAALRRGV